MSRPETRLAKIARLELRIHQLENDLTMAEYRLNSTQSWYRHVPPWITWFCFNWFKPKESNLFH